MQSAGHVHPLTWHASASQYPIADKLLLCPPELSSNGRLANSQTIGCQENIVFLPPRWPVECQVVQPAVSHVAESAEHLEDYYAAEVLNTAVLDDTTAVARPDHDTPVVYHYDPQAHTSAFSKSCAQLVTPSCASGDLSGGEVSEPRRSGSCGDTLTFESRFEAGNLKQARQVGRYSYELHVRRDLYTHRHAGWFYFQVANTRPNITYRFAVVNLARGGTMYSHGQRPLMYSQLAATQQAVGWRRTGTNIAFYCSPHRRDSDGQCECEMSENYVLSFGVRFPYAMDTVYLASGYPYSFSHLQQHLQFLQTDPFGSSVCHQRILCRSMAGNPVFLLTITAPDPPDTKRCKRAVVLIARVHPGESQASWIMQGILDFLTSHSAAAQLLRQHFVFKIVPMMNPDGVVVGNTRCCLSGRDMNRQYKHTLRDLFPAVWHVKLLVRRLMDDNGVALFCDIHGHSRRQNAFIYGCDNKKSSGRYLSERVFPFLLARNSPDLFDWDSCLFSIHRSKQGTARAVMWSMGITNAYTLEASVAGTSTHARCGAHFRIADYLMLGERFMHALLDYVDTAPDKELMRSRVVGAIRHRFGCPELDEDPDSSGDDSEEASKEKTKTSKQLRSRASKPSSGSSVRRKPSTFPDRAKSQEMLPSSSSSSGENRLKPKLVVCRSNSGGGRGKSSSSSSTSSSRRRFSPCSHAASPSRSLSLTSSPASDAPNTIVDGAGKESGGEGDGRTTVYRTRLDVPGPRHRRQASLNTCMSRVTIGPDSEEEADIRSGNRHPHTIHRTASRDCRGNSRHKSLSRSKRSAHS